MEVRLQPAKEAQFAEIAAKRGLKPDELAQQVLSVIWRMTAASLRR